MLENCLILFSVFTNDIDTQQEKRFGEGYPEFLFNFHAVEYFSGNLTPSPITSSRDECSSSFERKLNPTREVGKFSPTPSLHTTSSSLRFFYHSKLEHVFLPFSVKKRTGA